ncbi:hypothetical protein [Acetobacter senegalensis]|uniref:hypothetical protein n=1 Tax=Acetobacter senegalensis TaxID=446692 RepID=UPI001EDC7E58|nr:hypothetical protein [Acetobacter senegalensis]MCG4258245.1 hypothetical protein [Acetobacter senegalensis]MCG4268172.1 hypothetical protein [Acetobacter senegalensis]
MDDLLLKGLDFAARINAATRKAGGAAAFARQHGLKPQAVRDAVALKVIGDDVAKALGLVKVLRYPVLAQSNRLATGWEIQEKLASFIRSCGSQRAAAEKFGIHETHLSKIQNAHLGFNPVLATLGFGPPVVRFMLAKVAA